MDPTVTRIDAGECDWAVPDPHWDGHDMPHGIKARRLVSGAPEPWDGRFCIRHAKEAVERAKHGPDADF